MSRALTAPELALIRSSGQHSDVFLSVWKPAAVFAARVNQTFATSNGVAEITFDTVTTGAYTDVIEGMTLWIGSAAGLYDIGRARVRKAASSTVLYIGETSSITWADDLYLTVVNEFALWARHPRIVSDVIYADYDVAYTDQNENLSPVPVMGAALTPLWLTGADVTFEPDASDSYCIDDTISSYAWTASGGSVSGETTATPTFTFTTAGQYLITLTVTATNGKSSTGYRHVIVYTSASMPYRLVMQSCGTTQTGWSFSGVIYDDVSDISPGALCCLFTRDYFGATQSSIGTKAESANVLATGWIDGDIVSVDDEQSEWQFTAQSIDYWLDNLASFPFVYRYTSTPATWLDVPALTVDKALFNLLYWRSTAMFISDVILTGDTRIAPELDADGVTIAQQIRTIAGSKILATAKGLRYNNLKISIDAQLTPESDRAGLPVVMDITPADYVDRFEIPSINNDKVSMVELSGSYFDGLSEKPYFSRAYGDVFGRYGQQIAHDAILLSSQAQANTLAGLILSKENNQYPILRLVMSSGVKVFDIDGNQYATISVSSADNVRGIAWTTKKFIPRRISYSLDRNGFLQLSLELEAETFENLSESFDRPQTPIDNFVNKSRFDRTLIF